MLILQLFEMFKKILELSFTIMVEVNKNAQSRKFLIAEVLMKSSQKSSCMQI